jgi:hypothetical protein
LATYLPATLTSAQRRYLVREHVAGSAIFNAVLNAVLGALAFYAFGRAPLWGNPGIALDLVSTAFFLPFLTSVIATPLIGWAVRRGKAEGLAEGALEGTLIGRLPGGPWLRGAILGGLGMLSFAPPVVGVLALGLGGEGALSVPAFALLKAVYAGLLAALITPVVALFAMRAPPAR